MTHFLFLCLENENLKSWYLIECWNVALLESGMLIFK